MTVVCVAACFCASALGQIMPRFPAERPSPLVVSLAPRRTIIVYSRLKMMASKVILLLMVQEAQHGVLQGVVALVSWRPDPQVYILDL
jgi:hypothetical protein